MTAIASKHHSFGALPAVITRIATEISEFCTNFAVAVEVARMVDGHNEVPLEARRLLGIADEK
jgi:hypothetical protein